MKETTRKKKNKSLIHVSIILAMMTLIPGPLAIAQDKNYDEIEDVQDDIEALYIKVYDIIDEYPETVYSYVYEDGVVTEVKIEGIDNNRDQKQLEVFLLDLEELKEEIYNMSNRVGVYYVTETEPKPKMGYEKFYDLLHSELTYPDEAEDRGIEGNVYVKFIVDANGEIDYAVASESIETSANWIVDDMKKEAIGAVKATSGKWEPAKVGGIPVSQWVVLPVQFKLKSPYFRPIF